MHSIANARNSTPHPALDLSGNDLAPHDRPSLGIDVGAAEHYRNLTRGLICGPADSKVLRIQSTHCEQHRWEQLLWQIPDQLLWDLARGRTVVVHDRSERDRETRAMWQGLPLVKLVAEIAWFGNPTGTYQLERGGKSAWQHLYSVTQGLPRPLRRRFSYYRNHQSGDLNEVRLYSCFRTGHRRSHRDTEPPQRHGDTRAPA